MRAVAIIAALGIALVVTMGPAPASAQSSTTQVSNLSQGSSPFIAFNGDNAQAFTTGSNADGYKLTRVDMRMTRSNAQTPEPDYSVSIHANSSGVPGSEIDELDKPSSLAHTAFSRAEFTASGGGIDLAANTTYWVVLDVGTSTAAVQAAATNSDAETSGAGWTIANTRQHRGVSASSWILTDNDTQALEIAVEGYAKTDPTRPAVLVGNSGKADAGTLKLDRDRAQAFTTGSNAAGYRLTSVEIASNVDSAVGNWDVSIASAGSGGPGSTLTGGDLTEPSGLTTGIENSFTASGNGIDLAASTTYYIFIDMGAGHSAHWKSTNSDHEDPNPATGWTIGNASYFRAVGSTTTTWTQLGNNKMKIRVNGYAKVVPVVTGATVNGTSLVLTFNTELDTTSKPAANRFTISEDGGPARSATAISISGKEVRLTVPAVTGGRSVTVSYSKPASNPLKGATGADVAAFAAQPVTNNTTPPPAVTSAQINGATLILNFDKDLDTGSGTAAGRFTIEAGGSSHAATAISISARQVRLTVPAVRAGQFVTVSYSKPASNPLKGATGVDVAAFAAQAVTNNTRGDTASGTVRAPITVTYTNADGEEETVEIRAASAERETLLDYYEDACKRNPDPRFDSSLSCAFHGLYVRQSNCASEDWRRRNPHLLVSWCPEDRTW